VFYTYILKSEKDKKFYVGSTNNLRRRFREYNVGKVPAAKKRTPLKLVYYEFCIDKTDVRKRERYLKTSCWGKRYIKSRLKSYLTG